ncbi:MAG TPA: class I SAM-dependent methyltransferase [Symbiobacteriaceae bacterium]|nr:class I SAM-dependent methyltransferase [Symbiobacteriaceae bacterium]
MAVSESEVKQVVKRFWAQRAAEFDREPDHVLHSTAQHQAWLDLLGRFCPAVPSSVLDVGCGTGFLAFLYAELGHAVTGIDLAPEMIAIARQKAELHGCNVQFRVGDAERVAEQDESFDLVVARHLLWTLPDPVRAVTEWLRVLRPDGRLVLIEGHWGIGDLSGEYGQIHAHLPFFGGELGAKVAAFLQTCGVEDVVVEPLMATDLWHEVPRYPRYAVSGRKPVR